MKLKKVLKSKRGIALEGAVLLMLMSFMFCTLLISLSFIGSSQVKIEKITLQNDVEIDQIGEDFLAGKLKAKGNYGNYDYDVSEDQKVLTVWHLNDRSQKVLLYVEIDVDRQPVVWRYSSPTT